MTTLVLGATGLLGNAVFRVMSATCNAPVYGTVRREASRMHFIPCLRNKLVFCRDLESQNGLEALFSTVKPKVVVNCVAVGRPAPDDPMRSISVYSVLPHWLSHYCKMSGARLIQISSDGVFTGDRGLYRETDLPDSVELYGIAKFLGEVKEPHAVTIRTSVLGHELEGGRGLLEWFLSQGGTCQCYTRVVFSGLPAIELARVIRDFVVPNDALSGVYHVASKPISKFNLLSLVAQRYGKSITMVPDDSVVIDRSLAADLFWQATGYVPPTWPELIDAMFTHKFGLAKG